MVSEVKPVREQCPKRGAECRGSGGDKAVSGTADLALKAREPSSAGCKAQKAVLGLHFSSNSSPSIEYRWTFVFIAGHNYVRVV